jgi:hypothetical protein
MARNIKRVSIWSKFKISVGYPNFLVNIPHSCGSLALWCSAHTCRLVPDRAQHGARAKFRTAAVAGGPPGDGHSQPKYGVYEPQYAHGN